MKSLSKRRFIPACIIAAATMAVLALPGVASASFKLKQCGGVNISGNGSSLQKVLQNEYWNKQFSESANKAACNGTQGSKEERKAAYTSTGSGAGLESWGVETKAGGTVNFGAGNAYVGTDNAPNKTQKAELETNGTGGKLLTIPVAQAAITISVHLPAGCTKVSGGPVPGRLGIKDLTLEKVFQGTDTKWSQILNGAKLEGDAECTMLGEKLGNQACRARRRLGYHGDLHEVPVGPR